MLQHLPSHRVLKLRYEQVLEDPVTQLRTSVEFCGLDVTTRKLELLTTGINRSRGYSYLNEPELRDFTRNHQPGLAERGYK